MMSAYLQGGAKYVPERQHQSCLWATASWDAAADGGRHQDERQQTQGQSGGQQHQQESGQDSQEAQ